MNFRHFLWISYIALTLGVVNARRATVTSSRSNLRSENILVNFASSSVTAGSGDNFISVDLVTTPANSANAGIFVKIQVENGTAVVGTDFDLPDSDILEIGSSGNEFTFPVYHASDEQVYFTVRLVEVSSGAVISTPSTVTVNIDNSGIDASSQENLNAGNSVAGGSSSTVGSSTTGTANSMGVNQILTWVGVSVGSVIAVAGAAYGGVRVRNYVISQKSVEGQKTTPKENAGDQRQVRSVSPSKNATQTGIVPRSQSSPPAKKTGTVVVAGGGQSDSSLRSLFTRARKQSSAVEDELASVQPPLPPAPVLPNLPPSVTSPISFDDGELNSSVHVAIGSEPVSPKRISVPGGPRGGSPPEVRIGSANAFKGSPSSRVGTPGNNKLEFGLRIATQQFAKPRQFSQPKPLPTPPVSDDKLVTQLSEELQEESYDSKNDE
jgi:hypothetical protein